LDDKAALVAELGVQVGDRRFDDRPLVEQASQARAESPGHNQALEVHAALALGRGAR
jgi:hypothetical protein